MNARAGARAGSGAGARAGAGAGARAAAGARAGAAAGPRAVFRPFSCAFKQCAVERL